MTRDPDKRNAAGGEVTEKVATELVERPDVQPSAGGLFPGISQTFKMRSRCHD